MQVNTVFFLYSFGIGLFLSMHHVGLKMIKGDVNLALFYMYIVLAIINIAIVYINGGKASQLLLGDISWIILAGIGAGVFPYLIVKGYQLGFSISTLQISYTIFSTTFLLFIGYFIFRNNLNLYNVLGLVLGFFSVYLLTIK